MQIAFGMVFVGQQRSQKMVRKYTIALMMDQAINSTIKKPKELCSVYVLNSVSKKLKWFGFLVTKFQFAFDQFVSMFSFLATDALCCDAQMIKIMESSINKAAGIYGRCDTCLKNLFKSICALNCSPKQNEFLFGKTGKRVAENGTEGEWNWYHILAICFYIHNFSLTFRLVWNFAVKIIESLDYYITEEYVGGVFDSCKNVIVPATGGYALDASCGKYGSKACTPERMVS